VLCAVCCRCYPLAVLSVNITSPCSLSVASKRAISRSLHPSIHHPPPIHPPSQLNSQCSTHTHTPHPHSHHHIPITTQRVNKSLQSHPSSEMRRVTRCHGEDTRDHNPRVHRTDPQRLDATPTHQRPGWKSTVLRSSKISSEIGKPSIDSKSSLMTGTCHISSSRYVRSDRFYRTVQQQSVVGTYAKPTANILA
jgi:hypothetical protein